MKKVLILLALFSFAFFGCSPAPHLCHPEFSYQKKIEAAHHWEILAEDFSKQIAASLETENGQTVSASGLDKPHIYIQTNDLSPFGKAFRSNLVNELLSFGYHIAHRPDDALTLRWSVQKISHKADRRMSSFPGAFTAITALGYGVYKIFDESTAFAATITTGAVIDLEDQFGDSVFPGHVPHTEINLIMSISDNGVLLSRQTGTYYVNEEDRCHYDDIADFEGRETAPLPGKNYRIANK